MRQQDRLRDDGGVLGAVSLLPTARWDGWGGTGGMINSLVKDRDVPENSKTLILGYSNGYPPNDTKPWFF